MPHVLVVERVLDHATIEGRAVGQLEVASANLVQLLVLDPNRVLAPVEPAETVIRLIPEEIPLDILYLNAQAKVVSIHRMLPNDKDAFGEYVTTPSDAPSKYAIELNAGQAAASGVKVGDQIDLPPAATAPEGLE